MRVSRFAAVAAAVLAPLVIAGAALASPPSPATPAGHVSGVVPALGKGNKSGGGGGAGGNLVYHGGPVMLTNNTYAIYWVPDPYTVDGNYESLINGFFMNVAADSGKTTNVYYSDTQYYNGSGTHIAYSSSAAGSSVDTSPLPTSGCRDSYTNVCLSDAQIQAEVDKVASLKGWQRGTGNMFFLFTAKGIGSCYSSTSCAFSQYCAYHSNFSPSSGTTLYANMPYADTVPAACDAGYHPNSDDADATINVTSHEHNEAVTDALGTAWYDHRGYEDGDKCAWNFGAVTSGGWNQAIGNGHYILQQEWSNSSSGCVLSGL